MPLTVDRYELGPLQTNCYVVRRERGAEECAVIDPGGDAADLRLELARLQLRSVAAVLGIPDDLVNVLEECKKSVEVSIPTTMDDGSRQRCCMPKAVWNSRFPIRRSKRRSVNSHRWKVSMRCSLRRGSSTRWQTSARCYPHPAHQRQHA